MTSLSSSETGQVVDETYGSRSVAQDILVLEENFVFYFLVWIWKLDFFRQKKEDPILKAYNYSDLQAHTIYLLLKPGLLLQGVSFDLPPPSVFDNVPGPLKLLANRKFRRWPVLYIQGLGHIQGWQAIRNTL